MTDNLFSVAGKKIFVSGGTSGIGRMIVEGLAERGAQVFTCSRKAAAVASLLSELKEDRGLSVAAEVGDLSTVAGIEQVAARLDAHFGGTLDVLINNAGATWGASIDEYPENGWDKVFDLNVKAVFFMSQKCLPMLRKAAQPPARLARIINIGSISGIQHPSDNAWAYHPAKAAVHHLTEVMAKELVKQGIAVNAIAPGLFPSKMTAFMMPDGDTSLVNQGIPMGRPGLASDMVGTAVYLASDASAYTVGTIIKIDGGSAL